MLFWMKRRSPISDFDIRGAKSRSFKAKAVEERMICVDFLIENLK